MAVKNVIAKGIGFSPGSVKFIPTHGFTVGTAAAGGGEYIVIFRRRRFDGWWLLPWAAWPWLQMSRGWP